MALKSGHCNANYSRMDTFIAKASLQNDKSDHEPRLTHKLTNSLLTKSTTRKNSGLPYAALKYLSEIYQVFSFTFLENVSFSLPFYYFRCQKVFVYFVFDVKDNFLFYPTHLSHVMYLVSFLMDSKLRLQEITDD